MKKPGAATQRLSGNFSLENKRFASMGSDDDSANPPESIVVR
jgi:hypothetical protein